MSKVCFDKLVRKVFSEYFIEGRLSEDDLVMFLLCVCLSRGVKKIYRDCVEGKGYVDYDKKGLKSVCPFLK